MATENVQKRALNLFQSTVLNMIDMVGIGPFVTLPIVISIIGGMYLWAWVAGAVLAIFDAMIWSELGAAYPLAGGSYNFLKVSYGSNKAGKLMSFLYVWQTIIQAPLVAASAAIGFASYFTYLIPLKDWQQQLLSGAVIIFIVALLYRKIESIGKIAVFLWVGVVATMVWIIFAGITNGNFMQPIIDTANNSTFKTIASLAFGTAFGKTVYCYLGYYNVCHLGGEIKNPAKVIPKSMFLSILGITILYIAMNISITSKIPWQEIKHWVDIKDANKEYVISIFIKRLYGSTAAIVVTIMILWVALASLFAVLLGYSRVPFAAAKDGAFFKIFAKLHPTKNFPYVSLLVIGGIAFIFSLLFKMQQVISGILGMRIIIQFIGQAVGLILLRKREGTKNLPYKMLLYPIPIILAIAMWCGVFYATGNVVIASFAIVLCTGIMVYLIKANATKEWPFENKLEQS
jgi:amino acid transporter